MVTDGHQTYYGDQFVMYKMPNHYGIPLKLIKYYILIMLQF